MTKEVKGVFVRLPLSEEQVESVLNSYTGDKESTNVCMQKTILDLGTPVTGGDLYPVGYINEDAIGGLATGIYSSASIFREKDVEHYDTVSLVRQSDAQARIAALEAEVVRLRTELTNSKRENFNAGYLIACCNIYNMHNEEGIAANILRDAGITETEVKDLDLSEYDAEALAVIRSAGNDDPILKGGAA